MKIIRNTYPIHENCPHAEVGDIVEWELSKGAYRLIRKKDRACVFATAPVNSEGRLYSNKKFPQLTGIIAQVKSKGWVMEIR